jgi:hypothetical protein
MPRFWCDALFLVDDEIAQVVVEAADRAGQHQPLAGEKGQQGVDGPDIAHPRRTDPAGVFLVGFSHGCSLVERPGT